MAINPVISGGSYWPNQSIDEKVRHLQETSASARDLPRPEENLDLQKACQEFESLFIYFLLKIMRRSIPTGTFLGKGPGENMYTSLFDQEVAKDIAQHGGIGISQMMTRELSGPDQIIKHSDITRPSLRKLLDDKKMPDHAGSLPDESTQKTAAYRPPLRGKITSHFGLRKDPFTDKVCFHTGIDLAVAAGTEIKAAYSGKVIASKWKEGYGNVVVLKHDNNYTTTYAHNLKNLVRKGDIVESGQIIALVGDTGRATGPHLHFELRKNGSPVDPAKVVDLEA